MNAVARVQSFTCPCCGGFIGEAAPVPEILSAMADSNRKLILAALAKEPGRLVSQESLIDIMYGDRLDGGPDFAASAFNVHMHRLRKHIAKFGWAVVCTGRHNADFGRGGFYKLVPAEVSA